MLIYNDQKNYTYKKNEETYSMFIPEDNFWRQLNRLIDFSLIASHIKDKYSFTMGLSIDETSRMFKYLLLKAYYEQPYETLIEKSRTDIVFTYFLEYEPMEMARTDASLLYQFENVEAKADLINCLFDQIDSIKAQRDIEYVEDCFQKKLISVGEVASLVVMDMKSIILNTKN